MKESKTQLFLEYPNIKELIDTILSRMQHILGERLVGLYLYGSLAVGDFDYEISDIDLLAATTNKLSENEFNALGKMHGELVENNRQWNNRLEIAYVSQRALKTFKTQSSRIAIISPGEPFHFKEAGKDWLLNWYFVRENGVTLFGASPETIIAPVSKKEFIRAVREQAEEWREYVKYTEHSRPYQAYAILTLCRAFYAIENGDQVSKKQAAAWVQKRLPEYSFLIQNALKWRESHLDTNIIHETTFLETKEFVHHIIDKITAASDSNY